MYGVPVTHASLMLDVCPDDTILIGPTTRSLLPAMYKVKEYKEIASAPIAPAPRRLNRTNHNSVDVGIIDDIRTTD